MSTPPGFRFESKGPTFEGADQHRRLTSRMGTVHRGVGISSSTKAKCADSRCSSKDALHFYGTGRVGMVRPERFERPTYWFVASCSIQLSYGRTSSQAKRSPRLQ